MDIFERRKGVLKYGGYACYPYQRKLIGHMVKLGLLREVKEVLLPTDETSELLLSNLFSLPLQRAVSLCRTRTAEEFRSRALRWLNQPKEHFSGVGK